MGGATEVDRKWKVFWWLGFCRERRGRGVFVRVFIGFGRVLFFCLFFVVSFFYGFFFLRLFIGVILLVRFF